MPQCVAAEEKLQHAHLVPLSLKHMQTVRCHALLTELFEKMTQLEDQNRHV